MSIFNWGIYGGYGIAFPVGRYVPMLNAWDLVSRHCPFCAFPLRFASSAKRRHGAIASREIGASKGFQSRRDQVPNDATWNRPAI